MFVGRFFGEMVTALDVVGNAFIRLLQVSVIPYVALSLIAGVSKSFVTCFTGPTEVRAQDGTVT